MKPLILASRSPRRKELLTAAGLIFEVFPASEEAETPIPRGSDVSPAEFVKLQARLKAEDVVKRMPGRNCLVLGCDTVAVLGSRRRPGGYQILGKPENREDARRMLRQLSGSYHEVVSGICLKNPAEPGFEMLDAVTTVLFMEEISDEMLENYLNTGLWEGKAGAFGYQDGNDWLRVVSGSETNIVGLPMERLMEFLSVQCKNTQCHTGQHLQPSEHCHFSKLYMSIRTMWKKE